MNYPIYPNMGMPMPMMPPNNMGMMPPNMMMNMPSIPNMTTTATACSDQTNKLEQRINMLEKRVAALEGNNTNYNSSGYQML